MNFQNLRIGTRLWLAVGLLISIMAALIVFAAARASSTQVVAEQTTKVADAKTRIATRWSSLADGIVNRVLTGAINGDPAVAKVIDEGNAAAMQKIAELQKELKPLPLSETEKALLQKITEARGVLLESAAKITKLKQGGDIEAARAEANNHFAAASAPYMTALLEFAKLQEDTALKVQQQIGAERKLTVTICGIAVGLIVVGLIIGTYLLVRSIREPLLEAVGLAGDIAAGDLSHQQAVARGDELGDLMRALRAMSMSLSRTVGDVRVAADSIQVASSEIATGNNDLSQRTEQTASNLQKTASAMEQLTGTVKQSADSARTANQLASSAAQVAHRGGEVVSQVVSTMDEINSASKRIADIIGTIDGIAFQTNILALNAAVEAARAGEQGRGFAVVASEVRSLAQRSAEAAKEIKALIGASVDKVESGSKLVADAGSTMSEIVASVQRVSDIIAEISAAAAEQSSGIGQVNGAVNQLDQMTQQNAALVEESTAAAGTLNGQALQLTKLVATFKLGSQSGLAAPAALAVSTIAKASVAARKAPNAPAAPKPASTSPAPAPAPAVADGDWQSF